MGDRYFKISNKKAKKSAGKLKNLHFSVQEVENLNFKNDFFDAVISMWVLHWKAINLKKSSKEIYRVLKKKGIAIIGLLLNTKYYNGKVYKSKTRKEFLDTFKKFKIIKIREYESDDKYADPPHKHDVLMIYLRK